MRKWKAMMNTAQILQLLVSKYKKIGQENDDDTMVEMKYKYCDI